MSFFQFFRILWARRWIVVIATVSCFVAALLVGLALPPRYEAHSRLVFDNFKPDPITGEVMTSQSARSYISTQIELIKDYRTAGPAADLLGWTSSADLAAAYERRGDDDRRDFRQWVAQRIIDGLDARLVPGSNILDITFNSTNAATAAAVADAVRQTYVNQTLTDRRGDATTNAAWFRTQTTRIRQELVAAEKRKTDFERANGIVLQNDNTDTDTARLAAMTGAAAITPTQAMTPGESANPIGAQLAQADAQIATLSKTLGPNNPDLIALKRQRDALAQSNRGVRASIVTTGPSIQQQYSEQQRKVLSLRGKVSEAQQLAADVTVLRGQYLKAAERAADLEQQGEVSNSELSQLGSATVPTSPSFPKWPLIIFGSIAGGMALGVLAALALELVNRRVRGTDDLHQPGVPVIGEMAAVARTQARRIALPWRHAQPSTL